MEFIITWESRLAVRFPGEDAAYKYNWLFCTLLRMKPACLNGYLNGYIY